MLKTYIQHKRHPTFTLLREISSLGKKNTTTTITPYTHKNNLLKEQNKKANKQHKTLLQPCLLPELLSNF